MSATNCAIRTTRKSDGPLIREMLYYAIYVPDGSAPAPKAIVETPQLIKYYANWGRAGDAGYLAECGTELVAAVWIRLFNERDMAYGFIGNDIPELSMAVIEEFRNQGLGTELLNRLLYDREVLNYKALSLSVQKSNRAVNLYLRSGFRMFRETPETYIMVRRSQGIPGAAH